MFLDSFAHDPLLVSHANDRLPAHVPSRRLDPAQQARISVHLGLRVGRLRITVATLAATDSAPCTNALATRRSVCPGVGGSTRRVRHSARKYSRTSSERRTRSRQPRRTVMLAGQQIRLRRQQRPVLHQVREVLRETSHRPTSFRRDRPKTIPQSMINFLAAGRKIVNNAPDTTGTTSPAGPAHRPPPAANPTAHAAQRPGHPGKSPQGSRAVQATQ